MRSSRRQIDGVSEGSLKWRGRIQHHARHRFDRRPSTAEEEQHRQERRKKLAPVPEKNSMSRINRP